jgi:ParB-like chromosome segregation protein Spo0J
MLKIVPRKIDDLHGYARNARTHSDAQIAQIMASIVEFGYTNPILTDGNNGVVAGHGRLAASRRLRDAGTRIPNWHDTNLVPTIDLAHLSPAQKRAYVIADNKLALNAGWDDAMLALELGDLDAEGFDLGLIGFDQAELDALFADGDVGEEAGGEPAADGKGSLAGRFGVPPFTVLSARDGWWQDRKRAWIALGIRSELGRGAAPGGAPMPLDRSGGGKRDPRGLDDAGR